MKHPCKECLVKISCSEDCKKYTTFVRFWAQGMTLISMLITGILTAAILLVSEHLMDNGAEWIRLFVPLFWMVCIFYSIAVTELNQKPMGIIFIAAFAPMIAGSLFIMNRTKKWFWKYSVRA